jgi:hypothetical protein
MISGAGFTTMPGIPASPGRNFLASAARIFTSCRHRPSTMPDIAARWNYADIRGFKFTLTKDVYAQFSRTG